MTPTKSGQGRGEDWIDALPPLVRASAKGDASVVREHLREKPEQANEATEDGWTALHAAAARGHAEVVAILIDAGAVVDARDANGFTPLLNAAGPGNAEVVSRLLMSGANPNVRDTRNGWTPLHRAADYAQGEIVELLIAGGADVDAVDSGGGTPLMDAAEAGSTGIVLTLLRSGAATVLRAGGKSAADLARGRGHHEVAALIERHGQSPPE